MAYSDTDGRYTADLDDELYELDGIPEDGREAWQSLLTITAATAAIGGLLWGILWMIA